MATDDKLAGLFSTTEPVILDFPNLFEPKPFIDPDTGKARGEPKYGGNFILEVDSADLLSMKQLAIKLAKAKFPGRDIVAEYKAGKFMMPFQDGTALADARKEKKNKDDAAYLRGKCVIQAKSKYPTKLSGIVNGKVVDYDETTIIPAKKTFFSGAKVLVQFNFVAYNKVGANGLDGVTAYLNSVLTTGKGDRLSGAPPASEVFKDYVGSVSDEDPTTGSSLNDDEIPF